jgi:hypothetical protein
MTERMLCILNFGLAVLGSGAQTIPVIFLLPSGIVTSDPGSMDSLPLKLLR